MTERRPPAWWVWAALGVVYVVWGSTYLAIRYVIKTIPPMSGAGARFLLAAAVLGAVLAVRPGRAALRATGSELRTAALVGVLLCTGGNGLVNLAERSVPSGLTALIIACVPLFVVVLRRLGGERVGPVTTAGVLVGLAGVGILLLPGTQPHGVRATDLVLNVLAPLSWSIGSYLATRRPLPQNPFAASVYEMGAGGLALLLFGATRGEWRHWDIGHVSAASAWSWVYLVIAGSVVAFSAYVWLLGVAPVSTVSTYAFVNPVVAVALGALIAHERVAPGTLLGGAVIVLAVAVVVIDAGRNQRRARLVAPVEPPG